MLHGMSVYYMATSPYGGRFVFYARPFLSACSRAAQRPAVVLVLARRANGLRRFPALLAGDTSWLK